MSVSGIQVKVCGIRKAEDARYVQEAGADYVGMIHFNKSPRHLSIGEIESLLPSIESGKSVAVLVEPETSLVSELLALGVDQFQIHLKAPISNRLSEWSQLVSKDRLWIAPKLAPGVSFPHEILEFSNTILMDTFSKEQEGGTGKTGDWKGFRQIKESFPSVRFVLAGGLSPANIGQAIVDSGTNFVDVNSGVEEMAGVKSQEKMKTLFAELNKIIV